MPLSGLRIDTPGGLGMVGDRGVSATVLRLYTSVIPTVLRKMMRPYHTRQIHPVIVPAVDVAVESGSCEPVGDEYVSVVRVVGADADAVADDTDAVALAIAVAVVTTIDLTSM